MARRPFSNTRPPNTTVVCVVLAVTAPLASGCSFIFSEGAPDDHRARASFQCGESYAPPVVDTIGAGLLALISASDAQNKETNVANAVNNPEQTRHDINVAIGVAAAFAALDAASAIYGYHAVADCRDAQGIRLAELTRARVLPPPYGVPPYGEPPPVWPPRLPAPPPPAAARAPFDAAAPAAPEAAPGAPPAASGAPPAPPATPSP